MHFANCPACGRAVSMLREGELCTHGPGPDGEFVCPGSGDQAMVAAASHLSVEEIPHAPRKRPASASIFSRSRKGA